MLQENIRENNSFNENSCNQNGKTLMLKYVALNLNPLELFSSTIAVRPPRAPPCQKFNRIDPIKGGHDLSFTVTFSNVHLVLVCSTLHLRLISFCFTKMSAFSSRGVSVILSSAVSVISSSSKILFVLA